MWHKVFSSIPSLIVAKGPTMNTPIHSHVQLYVCKVFVDGVANGQAVANFLVFWMLVLDGVPNLLHELTSS
jgi:hypothetical protein